MSLAIPKKIIKRGDRELHITWEDEHESSFSFRDLRLHCPCASCVSELTGEKLLDETTIPENLTCTKAEIVGNYALRFHFSDNHNTGIYTFEKLRALSS